MLKLFDVCVIVIFVFDISFEPCYSGMMLILLDW